jgi:hypothetical protein
VQYDEYRLPKESLMKDNGNEDDDGDGGMMNDGDGGDGDY